MRGFVAAVAAAAAFCGAGVAQAGTVALANDVMTFEAGPGEANRVFVIRDSDGMHLIDTAVAVTAGGGCTQENGNEAFCASDDLTLLEIDVVADDENDYVDLRPAGLYLASQLDGGDGDDTLYGGFGFAGDVFDGGTGADTFGGNGDGTVDYSERTNPVTVTVGDELANDGEAGEGDFVPAGIRQVYGGHAADTLIVMNAPNVGTAYLNGGEGNDHISALQVNSTSIVDGNAGDDVLRTVGPDGTIFGGSGDDVLSGGHHGQALWGQSGEDTLRGHGGRDLLKGARRRRTHSAAGRERTRCWATTGTTRSWPATGSRTTSTVGAARTKRAPTPSTT